MMKFYHGGAPGLKPGDLLEPEPDSNSVYFTQNRLYAKFFASLGRGWLYLVEPIGDYGPASNDAMQACDAKSLRVIRVVEKAIRLTPNELRQIRRSELRYRKEMKG